MPTRTASAVGTVTPAPPHVYRDPTMPAGSPIYKTPPSTGVPQWRIARD